MTVRPPAVAGSFYPDDPHQLRRLVDAYLASPPCVPDLGSVKLLIAPHAGYLYSGAVAGTAFALLRRFAPSLSRVVLIGPAHWVAFRGIAVPTATAFATPLGALALDRQAVGELLEAGEAVAADLPHAPEHALEVELPFLQRTTGEVPIIPLLCGAAQDAAVQRALRRVWGGPETLIVISTDLSHYEPEVLARQHDACTAAAIERMDAAAIGPADACGFRAVRAALTLARAAGLRPVRLALRTSADSDGRRESVVGYGAWAFYQPQSAGGEAEGTASVEEARLAG